LLLKKKKLKKKSKKKDKKEKVTCVKAPDYSLAPLVSQKGFNMVEPLPSVDEIQKQIQQRQLQAEEVHRQNQEAISQQKEVEKELIIAAGGSPNDVSRRAAHLKQQRELIIAKKKAERERKAKEYESEQEIQFASLLAEDTSSKGAAEGGGSRELTDDEKRHMLRAALGRDFKKGLRRDESERLSELHEDQDLDLKQHIYRVDSLREENLSREKEISREIDFQQEERQRNIQTAIASQLLESAGYEY